MPGGRPTDYSPELAAKFCERLSRSPYGIHHVCKADDMPSSTVIYDWLLRHEEFPVMYARAREAQGCFVAEHAAAAVNEVEADRDQIARAREIANHGRWMAERLAPRKWGARQVIAGDPDAPLQVQTIHDLVKQVDE